MPPPTTEQVLETKAIDTLDAPGAAALMLRGQHAAVDAVEGAAREIDAGAQAMADAIRDGRSLVYAAAGSSGLMALADASELAGTFGISPDAIQIHMAGGVPVDARMPGDTEDDTATVEAIARDINAGDVVIVLSASGTTPFAVAVAKACKAQDATVVAIANNAGAELLGLADIAICLATPPEVIAGSTRLGAGTAQKVALNLMSSLMGVKLGHVYQGLMVNVVADNAKLVKRSVGIVSSISNVSADEAQAALKRTGGRVKAASLVALGCTVSLAEDLLTENNGHLDPCIQSLKSTQHTNV